MPIRQPRYPKEVFAERGDTIYEAKVRPLVEAEHRGEYVAIDIETGEWEMDADRLAADHRLLARIPDAQIWVVRVGFDVVDTIGASAGLETL